MTERDFDANPYDAQERRVAQYIVNIAGTGGGDDPIGFLIASHAALREELDRLKSASADTEKPR